MPLRDADPELPSDSSQGDIDQVWYALCQIMRRFAVNRCNQALALRTPVSERYWDWYEAAGAADATACSRIGSCGGVEISWVTEKGGPHDPTMQKDAGRTPASQLFPSYRKNLRSYRP